MDVVLILLVGISPWAAKMRACSFKRRLLAALIILAFITFAFNSGRVINQNVIVLFALLITLTVNGGMAALIVTASVEISTDDFISMIQQTGKASSLSINSAVIIFALGTALATILIITAPSSTLYFFRIRKRFSGLIVPVRFTFKINA